MKSIKVLFLMPFFLAFSCDGNKAESRDAGIDADKDTGFNTSADTDVDGDADMDTDSDTDTDTDTDNDTDADNDSDTDADEPSDVVFNCEVDSECRMKMGWVDDFGEVSSGWGSSCAALQDGSGACTGNVGDYSTYKDIFIAKYNSSGERQWTKCIGGTGYRYAHDIASSGNGCSIAAGLFRETAVFGYGEDNETTLYANGYNDFYLARYSPDGSLDWVRSIASLENKWGELYMDVIDGGLSVITGLFAGTAQFGVGDSGETILKSKGGGAVFIAKYNQSGSLEWARSAGGSDETDSAAATGISAHSDGTSVITGSFWGTVEFGPGEDAGVILSPCGDGEGDVFIAKYDSSGKLILAKKAGGSLSDSSHDIDMFPDQSFVITGMISDTAVFGEGEINETTLNISDGNIFIAKYNADGTLAWARSAKGYYGEGIAANNDGSSLLMGIGGPAENPCNGTFLAEYSPDGGLLWSDLVFEGTGGDDMAVAENGDAFITGGYDHAIFNSGCSNPTDIEVRFCDSVPCNSPFAAMFSNQ